MLAARPVLAVLSQGLVVLIYIANGSAAPWRDAGTWLPVYGTLTDLGCLFLLWRLTRREGIGLIDLIGFRRGQLVRELQLGVGLVPVCLCFIFGGVALSSLLVFGEVGIPQLGDRLPMGAALYAVLIWPLVWGVTEQMTYNGYLVPRLRALGGSIVAVVLVATVWAAQHAVMPVTFDGQYMLHRFLASIPNSLFMIFAFLRLKRLLPLVTAHWLMNGAAMFTGTLWPLLG
ncbi:CPBP family intramembrane metalloprotease [Devosia algicola]|uniref:CPBP family intramembrane metalloprotease n=1 Tax=Devosia algicola TaxID=3026418 RepID=A0ABY7YL36_9HYPH|nr:CPBP family intramembrane glutamic endopeptidase [Devosia algicola]WDR01942.1 CPBP family intramembrane metalloprotease [Devosia algicola]